MFTFDDIKDENTNAKYITYPLSLISDITTPSCTASVVNWRSSDDNVIDGSSGIPTRADELKTIALRATVVSGDINQTKTFILSVPPSTLDDKTKLSLELKDLTFDQIRLNNLQQNAIHSNLEFLTQGETYEDVNITWSSSNSSVISIDGNVTRENEDQLVTLEATLSIGELSVVKTFDLKVLKEINDDEEIVAKEYEKLTPKNILGDNISIDQIVTDMNLYKEGFYGATISWEAIEVDQNDIGSNYIDAGSSIVTRPNTGDKLVKLIATITSNGTSKIKEFLATVLTDTRKVASNIDTGAVFKNITNDNNGSISLNFEDRNISLTVDTSKFKVDTTTSESTVKTTIPMDDNKTLRSLDIYQNTNGTTQIVAEVEDNETNETLVSSIEVLTAIDIKTDIKDDGSIETNSTIDANTTTSMILDKDGFTKHIVDKEDTNTTTEVSSKIKGSSVVEKENDKGEVQIETTASVLKGDWLIKAIAISDENGNTHTKFTQVNTLTAQEKDIDNTLSSTTPYAPGNKVEIADVNNTLYIKTTTKIEDDLIIE